MGRTRLTFPTAKPKYESIWPDPKLCKHWIKAVLVTASQKKIQWIQVHKVISGLGHKHYKERI